MLADVLDGSAAVDEYEVRMVRWATFGLVVAIAAMATTVTVIVDQGSSTLLHLSRLTLQAGQRAVLFEAGAAWMEAAVIVNDHEKLNMTYEDAVGIFGTVEELQLNLFRDGHNF